MKSFEAEVVTEKEEFKVFIIAYNLIDAKEKLIDKLNKEYGRYTGFTLNEIDEYKYVLVRRC